MILHLLFLSAGARALAVGVTLAPADGVSTVGPRTPAWALLGEPVPVREDFGALSQELDAAWGERRALENGRAGLRVDALVAELRPVVDVGERDLLQRALFLKGVLAIDDVGGLDALTVDVTVVNGVRIPNAWVDAISASPGAAAPATADAAYAVQIYDQARTALTQMGGLILDPSAPGAGEVRVDGLTVNQEITLLAGAHTLSWHPIGADPVALEISVGSTAVGRYDAAALHAWLSALAAAQQGAPLDPTIRAQLHDAMQSPAVLISAGRGGRLVWLVDGAARWGPPAFDVGVSVGAWGLAETGGAAVACDGTVAPSGHALGVGSLEASLTVGPTRLRGGGGVAQGLGAGFAAVDETSCPSGLPGVQMITTLPWGWASVGRRFGLAGGNELEPFLRLGGTSTHAIVALGADLRLIRDSRVPRSIDVRVFAGPALNVWSGPEAHVALVGGLETVVSFGGR